MEAARTIRPGDGLYPDALARIADAPAALRLRGDLSAPPARVAVVGTRAPDDYGREMARRIASGLARARVSVVSGGALGVDALAHLAALDAGGHTVAVLGSGVDVPTPAGHRHLFARILGAGGALLSELPDGTPAARWTFPRRNRIVSGMSDAVVVVRGSGGSGALLTAEHARVQGVPVFAVPGEVGDPLAEAPLALLRAGARAAASAADVLAALGIAPQGELPLAEAEAQVGEGERALLAALGPRPRHADEVARAVRLPPGPALAGLLALELRGLCEQRPGHLFLRRAGG
ncbi:MAG TPA: DNA-processing protein DprA [Anaeromyxobacteraceae bacterium]|nr:DNA-processing protein DprA [Anaeromyxobacteraceae bacterium]